MRKTARFLDKAIDRVGYWHGFYWLLAGSGVMGLITGWISTGVDAISRFGWFGWWTVGILGALATALLLLFVALARFAWVSAKSRAKWMDAVDDFNPLHKEFKDKRLKAQDLAHPLINKIEGKRFYDCEIIGPANIFIYRGCTFYNLGFINCTVVVLWPDAKGNLLPGEAVVMEEVETHRGTICGATILISPSDIPTFKALGAPFATLTGDQEIDARWLPSS